MWLKIAYDILLDIENMIFRKSQLALFVSIIQNPHVITSHHREDSGE